MSFQGIRVGIVTVAVVLLLLLAAASAASADVAWKVDAMSNTTGAPGGQLSYIVQLTNVGEDAGVLPQLAVTLPAGMTFAPGWDPASAQLGGCTPAAPSGTSSFTCFWFEFVDRHSLAQVVLPVVVDPGVSPGTLLTSSFTVSGGGASDPASTVSNTRVSPSPPGFGVAALDGQVTSDAAGDPLTQAGGHPYSASVSIDFNTLQNPNPLVGALWPVEGTKDVMVDLPAGLVGYPPAAAVCTAAQLVGERSGFEPAPSCPPASQVGTTLVRVNGFGATSVFGPIAVYNMVPPPDVPARFGFNVAGSIVTLDAKVRADANYSLEIASANVTEALPIASTTTTLWGVPADPSHDGERACAGENEPFLAGQSGPTCSSGASEAAFLRNPTSCTPSTPGADGLTTAVHVDSWEHPGPVDAGGSPVLGDPRWQSAGFVSHLPPAYPQPPSAWGAHQLPTGCDKVPFTPTLKAEPQPPVNAGTPTGFNFDLSLPQSSDPSSIGEADLRKAVVTLPAGVRLSPSSASGLGACSPAQIGLGSNIEPSCPDSAKVGSLTVSTPLLEQTLTGSVYLATPHQNPFNSLIAIYLVVRGPGVVIKLPGRVDLDLSSGQITATFDDQPQLPFNDLHLEFKGGPRAPLTTPTQCGTYTTHAVLSSWSGKTVTSDSTFTVEHGPDGGPCASAGFSPGFTAGGEAPVAGAFTPFRLRLTRSDTDSEFGALSSLSLPPGLLADVASVSGRCSEAQATAAACPVASHVGTVTVGAGAGTNPLYLSGDVYLMGGFMSGPFRGDPFGLAFVVHALAGPFDLGYVVVRAGIRIHDDGSISTVAEPFPSILEGIPLDLRDVRVNLDRPGFTFNPTSCEPMAITGSLSALDGQRAALSERFRVGECASLAFKPRFSVSTQAHTSKAGGASLHVHLVTREGPSAHAQTPAEANIRKVEVSLPVVLPSRLTTLQKACTAAQFNSNPAGCPEGAFVGSAVARTPILNSPLTGPAILVSHGGAAFPDLVLVLQGEGITLHVTGHTQIKKGITFSRFETVPDAPVSSFDLELPEGPHSALAANGNLCGKTVTSKRRVTRRVHGRARRVLVKTRRQVPASLTMPTTITGQNGAVLHQTTHISVTGCAVPKAKTKAKKAHRTARHGKGRK